MTTYGERLRQVRENLDLKQTTVYKKTGIHNKVLSNYERNISLPDINNLKILCDFYEISADFILNTKHNSNRNISTSVQTPITIQIIDVLNQLDDISKGRFLQFGLELQKSNTQKI